MQFKRTPILLLLLVLTSLTAFGQIGGSSTYNFMELPVSARAAALGGYAITTRDGDLSTAASNPSFLDSTVNSHLVLTYIPYYAGINYGYVAYAHTIKDIGTFDAGIKYIDYGTFTQADNAGNITGVFGAGEYMFNIGYGRPVLDSLISAGANLKLISSHYAQYFSWGAAIDLGASYVSRDRRFTAGLVVQNIGEQFRDYITKDPEAIPFDVQVGIAEKLKHAPFRFDLGLQHLQKWDLTYIDPTDTETVNPVTGQTIKQTKLGGFADKLMRHFVPGVEALIGNSFALRIAYNYEMRRELELTARTGLVGLSAGFGIKIYKFELNYTWAEYHLAGASNTFTIGFNLGDFVPHKLETPYVPPPPPETPLLRDNH